MGRDYHNIMSADITKHVDHAREKPCSTCHKIKPLDEYHRDANRPDCHRSTCKECASEARKRYKASDPERYTNYNRRSLQAINADPEKRARRLANMRAYARQRHQRGFERKDYRLSTEEYLALLGAQGDVCAICRKPEIAIDTRLGKPRKLCIDHDHTTGKVRGLLCFKCNTNLALFERRDYVTAVQSYLEQHNPLKTYTPRVAETGQRTITLYFDNGAEAVEVTPTMLALLQDAEQHIPEQLSFDTIPQARLRAHHAGDCLTCWNGKAVYGRFCSKCMHENLEDVEHARDFFEKDGTWIEALEAYEAAQIGKGVANAAE